MSITFTTEELREITAEIADKDKEIARLRKALKAIRDDWTKHPIIQQTPSSQFMNSYAYRLVLLAEQALKGEWIMSETISDIVKRAIIQERVEKGEIEACFAAEVPPYTPEKFRRMWKKVTGKEITLAEAKKAMKEE